MEPVSVALLVGALALAIAAWRLPAHRARLAWAAIWVLAGALVALIFGAIYGLIAAVLALAPPPGRTWGQK